MRQTRTVTMRISGAFGEFVSTRVGENGHYENVGEDLRDLIWRDKEQTEQEAFHRLKAELTHAFASAEESDRPLSATDAIGRIQEDLPK